MDELRIGQVSALLLRPPDAAWLYVFAHGAGAGMRHAWMESMAQAFARHGVATLRFNFPSFEHGGRRPDKPEVAHATVRAAVEVASGLGLPLLAGGKSFGGRMTSQAQALEALPGVRGLAFLGFPLHPAGKPSVTRAEHLASVSLPMLFLSGDRDDLAELSLLRPTVEQLPQATLHVIAGANHAFAARKGVDVQEELARTLRAWADARFRGIERA